MSYEQLLEHSQILEAVVEEKQVAIEEKQAVIVGKQAVIDEKQAAIVGKQAVIDENKLPLKKRKPSLTRCRLRSARCSSRLTR